MADKGGYIGRNPGDSQVTIARQQFTPTGVTTDFTFTSGYTAGYVDVYINGAKILVGRDYTATNGSTVGLTSAAQNGDIVEIVAYKAFNVNNVSESAGNFTVGGILTVDDNTTLSGQLEVTGVTTFASNVENIVTSGVITATTFSGNITGTSVTFTNGTFTGDVSIGGTLTYEDVTNIDSVGIVTARAGVNVSGGQLLVGSGVTIGYAGVATFSGTADIHLKDNVRLNVGDASDLTLYHDASHSYVRSDSVALRIRSNDLRLQSATGEEYFYGVADGGAHLYHDNSLKLQTTGDGITVTGGVTADSAIISGHTAIGSGVTIGSAGVSTFSGTADVHLLDSVRLNVGDGSDLAIYHSGSHSFIEDSGTGSLKIRGSVIELSDTGAAQMLVATEDSTVNLYFNGSKKFETTTNGVKVTGEIQTGGTAGAKLSHAGTTSIYESQTAGDSLIFKTTPSGGSSTQALAINSVGDVELSGTAAGVKSCFWDASANSLIFNDTSYAKFGDSSDLSIYHSGTQSLIQHSGTGQLIIQGNDNDQVKIMKGSGEEGIILNNNANVELYFNNSKKFETTNDGTVTTGIGTISSSLVVGTDANVTGSWSQTDWNLEVYDSAADCYTLFAGAAGAAIELRDTVTLEAFVIAANGNCNLYSYNAGDDIAFWTKPGGGSVTQRLIIGAAGISTFSTTPHDDKGSLRRVPANTQTGGSAYTLVAADSGKLIARSGGSVTIPNNVFTTGDMVTILNNSGSDITLTASVSTLYNSADAATGNRTLAGRGMATIYFTGATSAYISGSGLS